MQNKKLTRGKKKYSPLVPLGSIEYSHRARDERNGGSSDATLRDFFSGVRESREDLRMLLETGFICCAMLPLTRDEDGELEKSRREEEEIFINSLSLVFSGKKCLGHVVKLHSTG